MERLKIAVTGASGFVGANLVRHFSKKHEVFALTRGINNWRLGGSFNIVDFNIRSKDMVSEAVNRIRPDVLIHCAVYGAYNFETSTREVIETNVIGSLNVIEACKDVPVFINTGSSSEYGIRNEPMKESDAIAPNSDYAMAKALITNLLRSAQTAVTLRLFSVYGYYEEKHRLIPSVLYPAIKGWKAKLSNKDNVRDFVFVEDVAEAYELAMQRYDKLEKGTVFNLGSGRQATVGDVVKEANVEVEWITSVRAGEPKRMWQADISKIEKEMGWRPRHSLKEGLGKTREWMEENIGLYENGKNDKQALFKQNSG